MKDHQVSLNTKCPCKQQQCPIRGNCVLCIQNHVEKKNHMPECMQNMVRKHIRALAEIVEYGCEDQRPDGNFWETYDKEKLVKESLDRHTPGREKFYDP